MVKRGDEYFEKGHVNWFVFLIHLILGAYFINIPFNYIKIPEQIFQFNDWIVLVGGIFMIFGAINYFRASR
jgi:hypothetical protein